MTTSVRLNEYPRPQYVRESWMNLNGKWAFDFDDGDFGEEEEWGKAPQLTKQINVPFTYETKASGIGVEEFHPIVWYQRAFDVPKEEAGKNVLLHFQASDYVTKVWINGSYVGEHQGGNVAFSFDISLYLRGSGPQQLVVRVEDSNSCHQPRGKQRWLDKNFGCWYVQTTGIWQTVWLEFVPEERLKDIKITPQFDRNAVSFDYIFHGGVDSNWRVETTISFKGREVRRVSFHPDRERMSHEVNLVANIHEWKVAHWSPEHPNLYDVEFKLYREDSLVDRVNSYFGLRKISTKDGQVLLNNRPIYQKLILDQGYWADTMLTPPSEEALVEDIDRMVDMGFNGVRKHQKIEDARFYHLCDKKGLLVWAEMPSTYEFSREAVENFTQEWGKVVDQLYNHPSIVTWVPFNESWGVGNILTDKKQQAFTEGIYHLTKSLDDTRPVIVNDGWEHTISDIITLHDYEEFAEQFLARYQEKEAILGNKVPHNKEKYPFANGYEYKGQPVLISEYGGIAFTTKDGWGYGNQVKNEKDFLARYRNITDAIKALPYVTGYCYTQITDVQQEVNGLLDERRKPKLDLKEIKDINDANV
ncbi:glycoside hydrolase family 2 protein [Shouchella shacheensis]|uniref:glycoside hydrolase family 2 protein n=1 Tax=Shouchella shacheensis TaxID=1649580 RepID=UPI000740570A|nr:glycoside hydrolase family 2 [Shouchella shacheensis]